MYIDTHTKKSMEESICSYFSITLEDLKNFFDSIIQKTQQDDSTNDLKSNEIFNSFIKAHISKNPIDEVLFFHLSRRLNAAENCKIGNNLFDLLSTENAVSLFLKEHDVEFKVSDKHLNLIYKGKEISLKDNNQRGIQHLLLRLGHIANKIDYCFNGFLLKDLLFSNRYVKSLYDVPEFISDLAIFLNCKSIGTDYFKNSKYYCFEYCVPLEKIVFDDNEKLDDEQKMIYLLNKILNRLFEYYTTNIIFMNDNHNTAIRLSDSDTMDEKYYITKEEITMDMIK